MESGIPEGREKLVYGFLVRGSLQASVGIPENLAHDALLTHRALSENGPQLAGVRECGVRNSNNLTLRVEIKIDFLIVLAIAGGTLDEDRLMFPQAADRVEALQPEADR